MKDNENGNKKKKQTAIDRFLGNDRVMSIIVLLGLAGIALIFISSALDPGKNEDTVPQQEINASDFSADDYKNALTEELGNMIASIEGAGKTKVMITLKGSVRDVYAADTDINGKESSKKNDNNENADKQNTEKKKYTIIRGKDGSEKALAIGQLVPEIKGVLVVCEGGENENVRETIINAVSAALDITNSHIYVTGLQS